LPKKNQPVARVRRLPLKSKTPPRHPPWKTRILAGRAVAAAPVLAVLEPEQVAREAPVAGQVVLVGAANQQISHPSQRRRLRPAPFFYT
jgi:hypothetical protein